MIHTDWSLVTNHVTSQGACALITWSVLLFRVCCGRSRFFLDQGLKTSGHWWIQDLPFWIQKKSPRSCPVVSRTNLTSVDPGSRIYPVGLRILSSPKVSVRMVFIPVTLPRLQRHKCQLLKTNLSPGGARCQPLFNDVATGA